MKALDDYTITLFEKLIHFDPARRLVSDFLWIKITIYTSSCKCLFFTVSIDAVCMKP